MQSWSEIVADFGRNWPVYVSMPIIAALIGYGTKLVAIKMMFRPQKFKGIGKLGWQGIIPRRAPQMVDILCDTLTGRLISSREIAGKIDGAEVAALIERPLRAEVGRVAREVLPEYQPTLWHVLPPVAQDLVIERVQDAAPDAVVRITEAITDDVDELFDLKAMVTEEFLADPDTLESMFLDVGRREFAFIRRSGLVFGFCIGLVQLLVWALFRNPYVMPLFGLFTGWFTDWAALRLIFNPKEPKKYLGVITWQGLFLKHRIPVSHEYGTLIATRVLTSDRLMRAVFTGKNSPKVVMVIAEVIEDSVREHLGDLEQLAGVDVASLPLLKELGITELPGLGAIGGEVGDLPVAGLLGVVSGVLSGPVRGATGLGLDVAGVQPMCNAAAADIAESLPAVLRGAEDYLTRVMEIQPIMAEKMAAMTPEEFEGVLRPAFQADERTLIMVGAILGFLVGELQVLLVEHLTH
ncbi:DUF445 domain-containing protein [Tsukamurella paurometabola]|uniref:Protein of uncharacterized function (DUF445) n=1 Tax=Tsukamurella paurometabola TaxID=2061 RepID=A0A3P8K3W2_TSUPA|nr:DUF445 family protein [Tsukamurella paurometabola]UEA82638.1 DUF445 family protein [Tsukamurella paurometabola]VDR39704.1 Protein of uncharacterised function (DUF445) [Tsukamurella paurometabola]